MENTWVDREDFTLYCAKWGDSERQLNFVGVIKDNADEYPICFVISITQINRIVSMQDDIPKRLSASGFKSASAVISAASWLADRLALCSWTASQLDFINTELVDQLTEKVKGEKQ